MVLVLLWDGFVFASSCISGSHVSRNLIMFSMALAVRSVNVMFSSVNVMFRYHASVLCMEKSCFGNNTNMDPS